MQVQKFELTSGKYQNIFAETVKKKMEQKQSVRGRLGILLVVNIFLV